MSEIGETPRACGEQIARTFEGQLHEEYPDADIRVCWEEKSEGDIDPYGAGKLVFSKGDLTLRLPVSSYGSFNRNSGRILPDGWNSAKKKLTAAGLLPPLE